jgi:hypothetical protein
MPDQAAFLGLLFHQERTTMGYGCGAQQLRWGGKQPVGDLTLILLLVARFATT